MDEGPRHTDNGKEGKNTEGLIFTSSTGRFYDDADGVPLPPSHGRPGPVVHSSDAGPSVPSDPNDADPRADRRYRRRTPNEPTRSPSVVVSAGGDEIRAHPATNHRTRDNCISMDRVGMWRIIYW